MFFNATRLVGASSRSMTASVVMKRTPIAMAQSLHTSAVLRKGPPTHSEEAVKADQGDHSVEDLQKQTNKGTNADSGAAGQTDSEEAAKADSHSHDPLPDHKKKGSSKPE